MSFIEEKAFRYRGSDPELRGCILYDPFVNASKVFKVRGNAMTKDGIFADDFVYRGFLVAKPVCYASVTGFLKDWGFADFSVL